MKKFERELLGAVLPVFADCVMQLLSGLSHAAAPALFRTPSPGL